MDSQIRQRGMDNKYICPNCKHYILILPPENPKIYKQKLLLGCSNCHSSLSAAWIVTLQVWTIRLFYEPTSSQIPEQDRGVRTRNKIMSYLRESDKKRIYPSLREIGEATGIRSTSTIHNHITTLLRQGKIRMKDRQGMNRNIEVVKELSEICSCCGGTGWAQPVQKQTIESILYDDR
jgi:hypothetical protein